MGPLSYHGVFVSKLVMVCKGLYLPSLIPVLELALWVKLSYSASVHDTLQVLNKYILNEINEARKKYQFSLS